MRDRTLTNERGDLIEAGSSCRAPGRSWPEGCGVGLGALLRPLWGRLGHRGRRPGRGSGGSSGKRLVKARLWRRGPGTLWGTWTEEPRDFLSASSKRSCVKGRLPKVSGPGGPGRSQVRPAGPASRVIPGRDLGACDSILTCQTSARGPRTLSLLSGGSRGPYPSPFRKLGDSKPWSSAC